ncbi:MAG: hypothetical protein HW391_1038 [Chloroflexi bacterium]|nr:hypothetical protein [Chloroflexota bacterium]
MADVQLTLDNADGLLPVEYGVVELGRRLYRSGENDYLLNRQRVRLRDLVDLLDAAHLAENAFLFIGQGMVDQALALRPEERRPLFEEVAGVRRHERRRRKAEEQLAESEVNLGRVEDVLGELRPQVRRLAAQAEQQTTRAGAGDELAAAILTAGHARWHAAAARISDAAAGLAAARLDVDGALGDLSVAETETAAIAAALGERVAVAAELRHRADAAQAALTGAQLREGQLVADLAAIDRERERIAAERGAAEADLAAGRRRLAEPVPVRDVDAEAALTEAERALADALGELAALQGAGREHEADLAAVRRAGAARAAELDTARRRLADAERALTVENQRAAEIAARLADEEALRAGAATELERGLAAEAAAAEARRAAVSLLERRMAEARIAAERAAAIATTLAAAEARHAARAAGVADDRASGVAVRLRSSGGRRLDEDLTVEPALRAAVDAALSGVARAYLATRELVGELAGERGIAIVADRGEAIGVTAPPAPSGPGAVTSKAEADDSAAFLGRLAAIGGGPLASAVRRDPSGAARQLLARAAWVPDISSALALQAGLPAGWIVVPIDGSAVVGELVVRLGTGERLLEDRAELERAAVELRSARLGHDGAAEAAAAADATAMQARLAVDAANSAEVVATATRRAAEEAERAASRRLEALAREAGWHAAQATRLAADVERTRLAIPEPPAPPAAGATEPERAALATWEERVTELRSRRDRLAELAASSDGIRREAERRRAGAEAAIALNAARIEAADRESAHLADRAHAIATAEASEGRVLAEARVMAEEARGALDGLLAADAADRERLIASDQASAAARERLRAAEDRSRIEEHRDLEARLGLDALREQVLVELAGLGPLGLAHLRTAAGTTSQEPVSVASGTRIVAADVAVGAADASDESDEGARLAAALEWAAERWAATDPPAETPGPGRLAVLRRRYHELGAANPYAMEEYATVRTRLDELERQHDDLRTAIARTRALISELETLISDQFRSTFRALESSFDRRFRQLFGGGYARLSLTDPADLSATGIEIVARPPGKKPQALAMLSGGERALTAVALLFAMLEVRPVPFCVLDEVDAALDEANVGRFTTALRELSERTQFVVITHNRGTIEIADALYGVTVGDDSVSRVISLKLEEATELAGRRRGPVAVGPAPEIAPNPV